MASCYGFYTVTIYFVNNYFLRQVFNDVIKGVGHERDSVGGVHAFHKLDLLGCWDRSAALEFDRKEDPLAGKAEDVAATNFPKLVEMVSFVPETPRIVSPAEKPFNRGEILKGRLLNLFFGCNGQPYNHLDWVLTLA